MTMTAPIKNLTSQRNGAQRAHAGQAGDVGAVVAGLAFGRGVAGGINDMKKSLRQPQAWQETDAQHTRNKRGCSSRMRVISSTARYATRAGR